ncbi:MAG: hypothetical protein JNL72_14820 [Flavipsychrobacter sp.]|nr:hypothetical protein [Flavipsychrobacter sp.]
MKKIVLTLAILAGASSLYAQSSTQDHINNTVKYEMGKLKNYNLTATQETALTKVNKDAAETMHQLGPSSADVNAFKKIAEKKDAEYKKILTKDQYEKWQKDANK